MQLVKSNDDVFQVWFLLMSTNFKEDLNYHVVTWHLLWLDGYIFLVKLRGGLTFAPIRWLDFFLSNSVNPV